jgi:hypothetical protein
MLTRCDEPICSSYQLDTATGPSTVRCERPAIPVDETPSACSAICEAVMFCPSAWLLFPAAVVFWPSAWLIDPDAVVLLPSA